MGSDPIVLYENGATWLCSSSEEEVSVLAETHLSRIYFFADPAELLAA